MFGRLTNANKADKSSSGRRGYSPSVIAEGMHVLGNIISDGVLDIDGKIDGNVRGETVTVRPNGSIRGDITAETVHVHGQVDGLIKAKNVMLYAEARVTGTIMHESIKIEDGAFVDGKFKRTDRLVLDDENSVIIRRLRAPSIDTTFDNDNEDEPQSEAEIKILENLRLIS
jgi:cytoskeletal protein CcmA (bactofilin family)